MAKVSVANNVTKSNRNWIRGYTIAGFVLFIVYQFLLPWDGLPSGIYQVVNQWMPPAAVNESLVYVIMALGLNIVVGYAGLLDLGYVAFWAIGGYCAGWFMSEFFYFLNIHFFGSVPAHQLLDGINHRWFCVRTFWCINWCTNTTLKE
jgi:branched-chain amino acid transport system permease protein